MATLLEASSKGGEQVIRRFALRAQHRMRISRQQLELNLLTFGDKPMKTPQARKMCASLRANVTIWALLRYAGERTKHGVAYAERRESLH